MAETQVLGPSSCYFPSFISPWALASNGSIASISLTSCTMMPASQMQVFKDLTHMLWVLWSLRNKRCPFFFYPGSWEQIMELICLEGLCEKWGREGDEGKGWRRSWSASVQPVREVFLQDVQGRKSGWTRSSWPTDGHVYWHNIHQEALGYEFCLQLRACKMNAPWKNSSKWCF